MSPHEAPEPAAEDLLAIDAHTTADLGLFKADSEGPSLFDYCNRTRSDGGARALRRRMERPWARPVRIEATQRALCAIADHRNIFDALPTAYLASGVERYRRSTLPRVSATNRIEFALGATLLWADNLRQYTTIAHGVQVTCRMLGALRRLLAAIDAGDIEVEGDLAPVLGGMRRCLEETRLAQAPDEAVGLWYPAVLRLDQIFRVHEPVALLELLRWAYDLEALVSMADVTRSEGLVMPELLDGALQVRAEALRHPFIAEAVGNPVDLGDSRSVLFLTGPNMAGKTTYLRAFATALYLAQLGMGVPADRFRFTPTRHLFSAISLRDDLHAGVSYFRAEALRVKDIAGAMATGSRVVAIMDEPFKGTNVKDAFDASRAILERLADRTDCLFMFSSHLIELETVVDGARSIDCRYFEAQEHTGRLSFDYRLRAGVSSQRLGMRVLEEEGVFDLLDER